MLKTRTPLKVWPKTLTDFIEKYDGNVTSWIISYGLRGDNIDDAKGDIYAIFLRKEVVEKFDPTIPKCADFLSYIRIKVNRLLCSRYRKEKRRNMTFSSLNGTNPDGDEYSIDVADTKFQRKDELGRWWEDHRSLLQDPAVREPIVAKRIGEKVYVVTPLLVLNMTLMGFSSDDMMRTFRLSRVAFNKIRSMIQEKLGPGMVWSDGGD